MTSSALMRDDALQLKTRLVQLRASSVACMRDKTKSFGVTRVPVSDRNPDGLRLTEAGKEAAKRFWASPTGDRWRRLHDALSRSSTGAKQVLDEVERGNWLAQAWDRNSNRALLASLQANAVQAGDMLAENYCPTLAPAVNRVRSSKLRWDSPLTPEVPATLNPLVYAGVAAVLLLLWRSK